MKHPNIKQAENFLFVIILLCIFGAGYFFGHLQAKRSITNTDTLIFRSHNEDSVKLHVVIKNGALQSFWYSKKYYRK
jgi:hypothetical protein